MSKLTRTYKYRLYPNKEQEQKLIWTLDRCRELYNAALSERRDAYRYAGKSITYYDQQNDLPEIKHEIREEYQRIDAHVLQDVLRRLDKAFQNFFRRCKSGENPGFPRFQGRNRYDSFTYPDKQGWRFGEKRLHLTKIGSLKIKLHRPIEGRIKTCTIKREGTEWYAIFSYEIEKSPKLAYTDETVGIDLGLLYFATLSTGDTIENPRFYRRTEKKLAKAQQALARKKYGSNRRKKAIKRMAKLHRKSRNQRRNFLHQTSRILVDTFDTLVFEDLQTTNLIKRLKPKQDEITGHYLPNGASAKAGLNKSITDAGWSQFVEYCTYKAEEAGRTVLQVKPQYTSQICSNCGQVRKKDLSERWHSCECGCSLDRDHNAAINILRLGRSLQGVLPVEAS